MSFKPGFESRERERERESRSLKQQVAVSSKSEMRQCLTIVWQMMNGNNTHESYDSVWVRAGKQKGHESLCENAVVCVCVMSM